MTNLLVRIRFSGHPVDWPDWTNLLILAGLPALMFVAMFVADLRARKRTDREHATVQPATHSLRRR